MGPSGTEGTFSRAAEETSKVLRDNSSALLTILSAIVSDPLYKWSVSPVKARRRQAAQNDIGEQYAINEDEEPSRAMPSSNEEHNKAAQQAVSPRVSGPHKGRQGARILLALAP